MTERRGYRLDWDAGPFAEIDVFLPDVSGIDVQNVDYQLRYTPPFRGTFRPRVRDLGLTTRDIKTIVGTGVDQLTRLVNSGPARRDASAGTGASVAARVAQTNKAMQTLGRQLLSILEERRNILNDLRSGMFLSIGMDEELLTYPWELMYDNDNYYCLKHKMGRVVNSPGYDPPPPEGTDWWGNRLEDFRVLIIDVGRTEQKTNYRHPPLDQAKIEGDAIQKILGDERLGVQCVRLSDEEATLERVKNTLYEHSIADKHFKIIHYCGHGAIDRANPSSSSLMLFDDPVTTRVIAKAFGESRPLLCFVNACESVDEMITDPAQPSVYTIGRAFLQTGAYVLGSRWKINDLAARAFAERFYSALLVESEAVGEAVRLARLACREELKVSAPGDLGWASYVYYGDPRIRFERDSKAN